MIKATLDQITYEEVAKQPTGVDWFDFVLGGGIPDNSKTYLCGNPGMGKSTGMSQIVSGLANQDIPCLYATGEERLAAVAIRTFRCGAPNNGSLVHLVETNCINDVIQYVKENPQIKYVIIDSVQAMVDPDAGGAPGQKQQAKAIVNKLNSNLTIPYIALGHNTKAGAFAGPQWVQHMVDITMQLKLASDDDFEQKRVLKCLKNRFAPTFNVAVLEMQEHGLEKIE